MSSSAAPPVDLSALEFWAQPPEQRERGFARLRDEAPVSWHPPFRGQLMPDVELTGYWAVTRYDDVRAVSRDPETYCSERGVMFEDVPQELLEASQSFLAMDDPRHMTLRKLVSAAFTPRQVRLIEDGIRADARTIVDQLEGREQGDFVELVAKRLPLMTIMRMLGVPGNDPEYLEGRTPLEVVGESMVALTEVATRLARERELEPADDLLSGLVQAEVDGKRLTHAEIGAFFILLSVAGNDTTRHTTSHAMRALCDYPDQRALLTTDLEAGLPGAVEEFVRWATPVMTFRRTATRDSVLGGQAISKGEKVVLIYPSANRDERAFESPGSFDITREPNRHVGFGGGGPHFCMGAAIARAQLRALFGDLLARYPELEVGEATYTVGNFVNGITRMAMDAGPRAEE